jgi:hypothetical protein
LSGRLTLGLIVVPLALIAWLVISLVLGGGAFSGAHSTLAPSGPSPVCLPATLEHDATLPGTNVSVSPAPETGTASPYTQISFLGIPVTDIQNVSVVGSQSGYHYGHLDGYYQGDGGSFVPYEPFDDGERVVVRAVLEGPGKGRQIGFSFRVDTPYPIGTISSFPNPPAPASSYQSFVSAPELHPPILDVTVPDRDPSAGDVITTVGPGPGQYGPLIYTPQGRVIWFDALPDGLGAENLSVQEYEGQRDLAWWQGHVLALGFGVGEDIVMNSDYQVIARVHGGNGLQADLHDFQLAPDNVAYVTAYNPIRCDLTPIGGPRNGAIIDTAVQEIDIKTGLVRWEWHSLDHVGVSESHATVPTKEKPVPWDYFHLNSIDPEPNGDLLVSGRSTWAAYQLEKGSGDILWRLGGTKSSFTMEPGTETAWQHDARMQPDGSVTFFDDGSDPRIHYQSRGVRVMPELAHRRTRLVRVYTHPTALLADSQGNNQVLYPSENVVLGWGAVGGVSEFAKNGSLLFDAHLPPGMSSYRAFRFPWEGHPLAPPALSAHLSSTADSTEIFASWNGASDVASWRILASTEDADSVKPVASIPDSGFESSTILPEAYKYVAVQALDASERLLGTSATVAVG